MSITLVYGSRVVDSADAIWTANANVTASIETTIKKKGSGAAKLAFTDIFATGVAGYKAISSMDMTAATQIRFWIRSSIGLDANDLQFLIDNTAGCVSPLETLNIGVLTADTWSQQTLNLATPANLTAVIAIGLNVAVDKNANFNVYLDDIVLVSESKTFDDLYTRGFDAPDSEICYPDITPKRLLDGSYKENYPSVANRMIEFQIITSTYAEYVFVRHWYFAQNVRQITYDSETIDVVRTGSDFMMEWPDGFFRVKNIVLSVMEKTARALNTIPSSWNN